MATNADLHVADNPLMEEQSTESAPAGSRPSAVVWQVMRFGLVGVLNTCIDLLALNILFWLFPTRSVGLLLLENSLAYSFGAVNSFLFNKYWTFRCLGRVEGR
ncbi:MAG TPA: GtrA family protein, partial [Ktedonobacterales bacterium]|nr:GtrA family protein [Ktedonobacterales bacterium]